MSRDEYLSILQSHLKNIPYDEAQNIIEYYREYFDEAGVENTDKVIEELGNPQVLAQKVCGDYAIRDMEQQGKGANGSKVKHKISNIWLIILAAIGSPVWVPLAIAGAAVVFALLIALFSVLFAVFVSSVVIVGAGALSIGVGVVATFQNVPAGMTVLGSGLIAVGLGILMYIGIYHLIKITKNGLVSFAKKKIRGKKNKNVGPDRQEGSNPYRQQNGSQYYQQNNRAQYGQQYNRPQYNQQNNATQNGQGFHESQPVWQNTDATQAPAQSESIKSEIIQDESHGSEQMNDEMQQQSEETRDDE